MSLCRPRDLALPHSGSMQKCVLAWDNEYPQSNSQLMGNGRQSSGGIILRYILYSYSEDLQQESIYWVFYLPCLAFSMSIPAYSRITFQINYLHPSFCLGILEEPKLRHASVSYPILWGSSGWMQRNHLSSLVCSSFPWKSRYHSIMWYSSGPFQDAW